MRFFSKNLCKITGRKRFLTGLLFVNTTFLVLCGQPDPVLNNCLSSSGAGTKYIKDYKIQLGEGNSLNEFRFKAKLSLTKNTKYRFTMCTDKKSKGQLVFMLINSDSKVLITSKDRETGVINPNVEFLCRKSGIYDIWYDFSEGQSGSGVSIVSMVQ